MFRDEEYLLNMLKVDIDLYNVFYFLGETSVTRETITTPHYIDLFRPQEILLEDFIKDVRSTATKKSAKIIQDYIDKLVSLGLCKYIVEDESGIDFNNSTDEKDSERLRFYKNLGLPKVDSSISLTNNNLMGCDGVSLYRKIVIDAEEKIKDENYKKELKSAFIKVFSPYEQEIDKLKNEIQNKINEMNKNVDSGVIKNIQVISVFAGIISLLFANIMGIKEFATIGIIGILILNVSTVTSIFSLLLFSKWLIIGEKVKCATILISILIIIILIIPIILLKLQWI